MPAPETLSSHNARRALLAAQDTDTVTTRVFDIAAALSMAGHDPRTGAARQIHPPPARPRQQELTAYHHAHQALAAAIAADDHHLAPINAGQGVAMLQSVRPAAEVIDQLCADAAPLLDHPIRPSLRLRA